MALENMMSSKKAKQEEIKVQTKKEEPKASKTYLKLDTTGLDDYILQASLRESVKQGKKVSKTEYIQNLIKADMEQNKGNM